MERGSLEMTDDEIERLIRPLLIGEPRVVLSPPLTSVDDYMTYLKEHREDYRALFGLQRR